MTATRSDAISSVVDGAEERPEEPLSKDTVFHLLQNGRRRLTLRYLREVEADAELRDIAEQVAAWEHEVSVQQLRSNQRQRVYIALYQSHLSKLADEGVIEFDKHRKTIERTSLADQLDRYLELDARAIADAGEMDDEPLPSSEDDRSFDESILDPLSSPQLAATAVAGVGVTTLAVNVGSASWPNMTAAAAGICTFLSLIAVALVGHFRTVDK